MNHSLWVGWLVVADALEVWRWNSYVCNVGVMNGLMMDWKGMVLVCTGKGSNQEKMRDLQG